MTGTWPPYRVRTERLVLRPWDPADTDALVSLQRRNFARLLPWMAWSQHVLSQSEMLERIRAWRSVFDQSEHLLYGMFLPAGQALGEVGLHPVPGTKSKTMMVAYWLDGAHEGQGYATEATAALVQLATGPYALGSVELHCDPNNERSEAVAKRLKFKLQKTLTGQGSDGLGRKHDVNVWSFAVDRNKKKPDPRPPFAFRTEAWDGAGRPLLSHRP